MATQFDVKRWHRRRHMFAIWHDTLLIAPAQVTYGHEEWFRALVGHPDWVEAMMTAAPRGYALDGDLHAYYGHQFQEDENLRLSIWQHLPQLLRVFALDGTGCLHYGKKPGNGVPGEWPALVTLSPLSSLCYGESKGPRRSAEVRLRVPEGVVLNSRAALNAVTEGLLQHGVPYCVEPRQSTWQVLVANNAENNYRAELLRELSAPWQADSAPTPEPQRERSLARLRLLDAQAQRLRQELQLDAPHKVVATWETTDGQILVEADGYGGAYVGEYVGTDLSNRTERRGEKCAEVVAAHAVALQWAAAQRRQ